METTKVIRVDIEVLQRLQEFATSELDTPNNCIRRALGMPEKSLPSRSAFASLKTK